ncbi:MAG TPA: hypothetical protein VFA59_08610 [Vicinamibacterales bacterium]|nr:hypothetical protein [Vicinamibacterales bacterium]
MNLKYFHLFFIAISVVLAAFVAMWGVNEGRTIAIVLSVLSAIALVVYGTAFQRKMRRL